MNKTQSISATPASFSSTSDAPVLVQHFDYIIAGAGCAGLSLAWRLLKAGVKEKILLVDRSLKNENDRTWCFWENKKNDFEEIVYKKWKQLEFHGKDFSKRLHTSPYEYKMIRGIDFYEFIIPQLLAAPNIQFLQADIKNMEANPQEASLYTDKGVFTANYLFNSAIIEKVKPKANSTIQHFKGWVVETEEEVFDEEVGTFMDFRIEQKGETRFFYVLPTSKKTALIEGTVFSNQLLSDKEYDDLIKNYLKEYLPLGKYKITESETGAIPMTDHPFKRGVNGRIINLGTSGGIVKPSSGYTFIRIQEHTAQIVEALQSGNTPLVQPSLYEQRFRYYDGILLNVMLHNRLPTKVAFTDLFKYNSVQSVFKFLDEKTSPAEEIRLMFSLPKPPFLRALANEVWKRIF